MRHARAPAPRTAGSPMRSVSVVVPTYNCAPRLMQAIASVAAQTCARDKLELVVVDDGSTDDSGERVREFAAAASFPVRYVRQQNAGAAAARNHGIRVARGDAIAFLDADDTWLPSKLEQQVPLLRGAVALVYCANSFVDAFGRALPDYVRQVPMHRGDILLPLFCNFFLLTSAVVMTRAAIMLTGPFDERLAVGEDYEFFLRAARRFHADHVPRQLLVRCVRPDSLSRRDYALDARVDLETLLGFLRAHPDFARRHRREVGERIARYRYDFAWRLLEENRRKEAIIELVRSLRSSASVAAARTLVRALVPASRAAA